MLEKQQEETVSAFLEDVKKADTFDALTDLGREVSRFKSQSWFANHCWQPLKYKIDQFLKKRPQRTILVIDLMSVIHTIYAAKNGKPDIADTIKRIENIRGNLKNIPYLIAHDSGTTFRSEIIPDFKGDRDGHTPELDKYINDVLIALWNEDAIPVCFDNFEADDVMASIALTCAIWGDQTILETPDRDLWQALGPCTKMHSKSGFFTREDLMEKHGITPCQAVDWMTLVGKNGLKGAKNIGPAHASKLLKQYGSLIDILNKREEITRFKETLDNFVEEYLPLKRVHTLFNTLPIKHSIIESLYG